MTVGTAEARAAGAIRLAGEMVALEATRLATGLSVARSVRAGVVTAVRAATADPEIRPVKVPTDRGTVQAVGTGNRQTEEIGSLAEQTVSRARGTAIGVIGPGMVMAGIPAVLVSGAPVRAILTGVLRVTETLAARELAGRAPIGADLIDAVPIDPPQTDLAPGATTVTDPAPGVLAPVAVLTSATQGGATSNGGGMTGQATIGRVMTGATTTGAEGTLAARRTDGAGILRCQRRLPLISSRRRLGRSFGHCLVISPRPWLGC